MCALQLSWSLQEIHMLKRQLQQQDTLQPKYTQ